MLLKYMFTFFPLKMCIRDRLKDGDIITLDGKANVKVSYTAPEGYSEGGAYDTFTLEGINEPLTAIEVEQPEKTHYYVGDEFEADKLTVYALYGSDMVLLKPVSYTHLDVYKRQVHRLF